MHHYSGLRQKAFSLLGGVWQTRSEEQAIPVGARVSAVAALAAIQVTAIETALVLAKDSLAELQTSLNTGIGPADLLSSYIPPSPVVLPEWQQPEPGVYHAPYSTDLDREAAKPLVTSIFNNAMAYGRLSANERDFIIAYANATIAAGRVDAILSSQIMSLLTFYPAHPRVLLLLSNLYAHREKYIVAAYLSLQLIDAAEEGGHHAVEALSNMAVLLSKLVRSPVDSSIDMLVLTLLSVQKQPEAAEAHLHRALHQKPTFFAGILNYLHVICSFKSPPGVTGPAKAQAALATCLELESRFLDKTTPVSMVNQLPLSQFHEVQQYYLVKGRLYMSLQDLPKALKGFCTGLELILAQPVRTEAGTDMSFASFSCKELVRATYLQVRYAWLLQQGRAGEAALEEVGKRIEQMSSKEASLDILSKNCLWCVRRTRNGLQLTSSHFRLLRQYPDIALADTLPHRATSDEMPALFLTVSHARIVLKGALLTLDLQSDASSKLATRVLSVGRISSTALVLPVSRATSVSAAMRTKADADIREASCMLIMAIARCVDIAMTSQSTRHAHRGIG